MKKNTFYDLNYTDLPQTGYVFMIVCCVSNEYYQKGCHTHALSESKTNYNIY